MAVLEARDRVGGRTLNHALGGGEIVEIGGQWVGPTQDRILALIGELGLHTFPTFNTGKNVYYRAACDSTYTGAIPPANPVALLELAGVLQQLNEMARQVPLDAPWKAGRAAEWDGQTVETWKRAHAQLAETRELVDLGIEAVWAAEPPRRLAARTPSGTSTRPAASTTSSTRPAAPRSSASLAARSGSRSSWRSGSGSGSCARRRSHAIEQRGKRCG